MGWLIMIGGLLMAAVVALFIDAWDRHARRKQYDDAAKLHAERVEHEAIGGDERTKLNWETR